MIEKITSLQEFTNHGHIPPELKLLGIENFSDIHYEPFRIIYQIIEKVFFVHSVLVERRDMQKLLEERLMRE